MTIKKDFHGYSYNEASDEVHDIVAKIRGARKTENVELITGHGLIRDNIIFILRNYGLHPTIKLGNFGVIVCVVE